jgi:hemoglobin/transferrin/lactoferrin receptor protein
MVPPKDTVALDLGTCLLDDKLTVGGRFTYIGKRMAEGMGNNLDPSYSGNRINASTGNPYGVVDLYASYKPSENLQLDLAIDNLTDRYYMDALNVTLLPAPGRTVRGSLTVKF